MKWPSSSTPRQRRLRGALNSSGIEYIDDYSVTVASRAITYRPYDEPYEVRVILVYDPEARSLTHRVDGFIRRRRRWDRSPR